MLPACLSEAFMYEHSVQMYAMQAYENLMPRPGSEATAIAEILSRFIQEPATSNAAGS